MLVTKLTCPNCQAVLKTAKPVAVGKMITCVKCQTPFAATAEMQRTSTGESHTGSSHTLPGSQTDVEPVTRLNGSAHGVKPVPRVTVAPASPRVVAAGAPPRRPAATDDDDSEPLVRGRSRQKSNAGLIAGIAAFVLLIGTTITLAIIFLRGDDKKKDEPKIVFTDTTKKSSSPSPSPERKKIQASNNPSPSPTVDPNPKQVVDNNKKPKEKDLPKVDPESPDFMKTLTAKEQAKVDAAIAKGVKYLLDVAPEDGNWKKMIAPDAKIVEGEEHHTVGYTALPALALLECQVSPKHPVIQKSAEFVRSQKATIDDTYSLGLAVLFLDRLGDPQDRLLIKSLTMRLVAGQTAAGGWWYRCPILNAAEEEALNKFMSINKPKIEFLNPLQGKPSGDLRSLPDRGEPSPVRGRVTSRQADTRPLTGLGSPSDFVFTALQAQETPKAGALPPKLRDLPVVTNKLKNAKNIKLEGVRDDNSNTQFGMLGLWAARRHDVPTELSLEMAAMRFRQTQAPADGGWSYAPPRWDEGKILYNPTKNTMMCVGMLGLAMGHGAAAEAFVEATKKGKISRPPAEDKAIKFAIHGLGEYIDGKEKELRGLEARIDLYYLWTLERVGMLYQQKNFGSRDWYRWGVDIILDKHGSDGSWQFRYEPAIDTAFALLFLKRSNLVGDLTQNLQFYIAIPKK